MEQFHQSSSRCRNEAGEEGSTSARENNKSNDGPMAQNDGSRFQNDNTEIQGNVELRRSARTK